MVRRVLFLQCVNAGMYPPIINAASLFAEAGWTVHILSSPSPDTATLVVPRAPGISHHETTMRRSYLVRPIDFARYLADTAALAIRLRPRLIYASDPLGALPGLLAARLSGANLVYHEHDSPAAGTLRPGLARWRARATRCARLVVFPNAERAKIAQEELNFGADRLRIVWNVPRCAELAPPAAAPDPPLVLYYHGSINAQRLPEAVVEAIQRFGGRVRLRVAGYEAPGSPGYISRVVGLGQRVGATPLVEYVGQFPTRERLLAQAAGAHVGLAVMPKASRDVNMRHMTGASNKAFDYMAVGLPLLVSDLPDWCDMYVSPGYGRACDPTNADSVAAALAWFLEHANERRAMAARNRAKIEADWNYATVFAPVMEELSIG